MNWKHNSKNITSIDNMPEGTIGFIYLLTLSNGKYYIGKKNIYSTRKKNFGKKKIAQITDKRLKKYEYITTESNWKTYNGSSELLKILPDNISVINRKILAFAKTSKELTYLETKYLFLNNVLEDKDFYNQNILGKFFK